MIPNEELSEHTHKTWANWVVCMLIHGTVNPDGSVTIPAPLVKRWKTLAHTPYRKLRDREKKYHREEAVAIQRLYIGDSDDTYEERRE